MALENTYYVGAIPKKTPERWLRRSAHQSADENSDFSRLCLMNFRYL
jgi:hypothetical protein